MTPVIRFHTCPVISQCGTAASADRTSGEQPACRYVSSELREVDHAGRQEARRKARTVRECRCYPGGARSEMRLCEVRGAGVGGPRVRGRGCAVRGAGRDARGAATAATRIPG